MMTTDRPGAISVLIVDHTPIILRALVRWIEQLEGLRLVGAVDGVNAAIAMESQSQPEVILYGLSMLLPRSLEDLPVLRRNLPESYIITTSFEPNDESRDPALANGADDYVTGFKLDTDLFPAILRSRRDRQ